MKERSIGKNHYHTNNKPNKRSSRSWAQIHYASADTRANSYIRTTEGYGNSHYKSPFNEKLTFGGRVKRFFSEIFIKKHVKTPSVKSRISQLQKPIGVNVKENLLQATTRVHQRKGKR